MVRVNVCDGFGKAPSWSNNSAESIHESGTEMPGSCKFSVVFGNYKEPC